MTAIERHARVAWHGDLESGAGGVVLGVGAVGPFQVDWHARMQQHADLTSPEELLASALASSIAMEFVRLLDQLGTPPRTIHVRCVCILDHVGDQRLVTDVEVDVGGDVPGIAEVDFVDLAERAARTSPVATSLARSDVRVRAHLLHAAGV